MGSFLIVLGVLAFGVALGFNQAWRSARALRQRAAAELTQLKSDLAQRHLIASHLTDSLPESFDREFDRAQCTRVRGNAENSLKEVDAAAPQSTHIASSSDHEEELCRLLDDLVRRVSADDSLSQAQAVSACLQGLDEANRRIRDSVATYNASAITYSSFLERPMISIVSVALPQGEFDIFDVNLLGGTDSRDQSRA